MPLRRYSRSRQQDNQPLQFLRLPCLILLITKLAAIHADSCQPPCHIGRGVCVKSQCFCQSPWGGDDCSSKVSGSSAHGDAFGEDSQVSQSSAGSNYIYATPPLALAASLIRFPTGVGGDGVAPAEQKLQEASPKPEHFAEGDVGPKQSVQGAQSDVTPGLHARTPLRSGAAIHEVTTGHVGSTLFKHGKMQMPSFVEDAPGDPQFPFEATIADEVAPPTYPAISIVRDPRNGIFREPKKQAEEHKFMIHNIFPEADTLTEPVARSTHRLLSRKWPHEHAASDGKKDVAQLRDARASLQQELEELNADANVLKMKGDPVAKALLRDLKPVREDVKFVAHQAQVGETLTTTQCIAPPLCFQGVLVFLLLAFATLNHFFKKAVDDHHGGWTCGMCVLMARCISQLHVYTIGLGLLYMVVLDGVWIQMCSNGSAQEYLAVIGIYSFLAFCILGLVFLLFMEIYLRYIAKHVQRARDLEDQVSSLVSLLDVKYGEQLKKRKEDITKAASRMADVVDDTTDFLGITEASSEDDVTCFNACRTGTQKTTKLKAKKSKS